MTQVTWQDIETSLANIESEKDILKKAERLLKIQKSVHVQFDKDKKHFADLRNKETRNQTVNLRIIAVATGALTSVAATLGFCLIPLGGVALGLLLGGLWGSLGALGCMIAGEAFFSGGPQSRFQAGIEQSTGMSKKFSNQIENAFDAINRQSASIKDSSVKKKVRDTFCTAVAHRKEAEKAHEPMHGNSANAGEQSLSTKSAVKISLHVANQINFR